MDVFLPAHDADTLVCGTSYGSVRLHNYPCTDALHHRYPAHVGTVGHAKLSFDGKKMVSSGVTDRCVIQWSYNVHTIESVTLPGAIAVKVKRSLKPTKQVTPAESSGEVLLICVFFFSLTHSHITSFMLKYMLFFNI